MTEFVFAPATKAQAKARVAIDGPSGSGKTWTALSIAQGLGQRIAVIDTERGSASKYAGDFRFDTLQMHTYDPRDLVKALSAASGAGFDVVIVDSLSHFWMGTEGLLEQVDKSTKRSGGSSFSSGWKDARPIERAMIDGLLAYPGHVIVTMRTKSEWVITENDRGKKEPKKIGLKAEQRDGLEYEFDIVGDLDLDHNLVISKSRMSALADKVIARPTANMGSEILSWLSDGTSLPTVEDYILRASRATTADEVREVYREVQTRNLGAAPCMRSGQPTTLRQLVIDRGTELGQAPVPPAPAEVERSRPRQPAEDEWTQPAPEQRAPEQQAPAEPRMASEGQLTALHAILAKKKGPLTPEARHAGLSAYTKRQITSAKQLTSREAGALMDMLATQPDFVPPQPAQQPERFGPDELGAEMIRQHQESRRVDLSDASPEAVAEAHRLTQLPPDPTAVEEVLRDSIESAGDPDQLNRAMGPVFAAEEAGRIDQDAVDRLSVLRLRRRDELEAHAGWARQRLTTMTGVAA